MAEWSKEIDSRSIIFGCAGSNPAGTILKIGYSKQLRGNSHQTFNLFSDMLKIGMSFPWMQHPI